MTLHAIILTARNAHNLERYKAKRRADYFQLAGIPDHRTAEERKAYRVMMARRVRPSTTPYQRAVLEYVARLPPLRVPLYWPMGAGQHG